MLNFLSWEVESGVKGVIGGLRMLSVPQTYGDVQMIHEIALKSGVLLRLQLKHG
jgi:hypothetical protein